MKILRNAMMIIFFCLLVLVVVLGCFYRYSVSAVDKNDKTFVEIEIPSGSTTTGIGKILKENDLVHSKNIFRLYCTIYKIDSLKAGTYSLSKSMDLKTIVEVLKKGNNYNPDEISITFKEGINMRKIAKTIADNTNNTEQDVYDKLKDSKYIDSLIEKYWFLDSSIKNSSIYYPLEGYLYPDTYRFVNKDVSVEEIFKKLLDAEDKFLTKYKKEINNSKYSVHELLSLASVVELESVTESDRAGVAGVFYNRLNSNMQLGSDVTSYYANKVDMSERDLTVAEYNYNSPYNTRIASNAGKIPVGPIASVSETAFKAVINPTKHNYYYFVSDKNRKIYFSTTYAEQNKKIKELKEKGLWYEW